MIHAHQSASHRYFQMLFLIVLLWTCKFLIDWALMRCHDLFFYHLFGAMSNVLRLHSCWWLYSNKIYFKKATYHWPIYSSSKLLKYYQKHLVGLLFLLFQVSDSQCILLFCTYYCRLCQTYAELTDFSFWILTKLWWILNIIFFDIPIRFSF